MFKVCEDPIYFQQWLHHFTFLQTVQKGSNFSTSFPTLVTFWRTFFLKNLLIQQISPEDPPSTKTAFFWFPGIHNFNRTTSWPWGCHGIGGGAYYIGAVSRAYSSARGVRGQWWPLRRNYFHPHFQVKKLRLRNLKLLA